MYLRYNPEFDMWLPISKTELYNTYQHLVAIDKAETDYPLFKEWIAEQIKKGLLKLSSNNKKNNS